MVRNFIVNIDEYEKLLKSLNDKGVNIVAGMDAGNPYVFPEFSLHEELRYMNNAALTPYETLKATTINAAKILGYQERLGTNEVGKDADLVLLAENPLEDIRNTTSIKGVMTKGILDSMLYEVEKYYAHK